MTDGNNLKLGKNGNSADFSKIKSGIKSDEFKKDAKMLELFKSCDTNKNETLDLEEVSLFVNKVKDAAGEDLTLSEKEAKIILKDNENKEQLKKADVKAKDLFGFVNKLIDLSAQVEEKPSVTQQAKPIVANKDGAQEIINQDGSKIVTLIKAGKPTTQYFDDDGKLTKEVEGEGTPEEKVTEFNYTDENNFIQTITQGDVKSITVIENNDVKTTTAVLYKDGNPIQEIMIDAEGNRTDTVYAANGKKLHSKMINENGTEQIANYDGNGNTLVVVQNGETINELSQTFGYTKAEILASNKGRVYGIKDNPYFIAGQQIKLAGELSPDTEGLQGRKSTAEVSQEYTRDELKRVANNLQGREIKTIKLEKSYSSWSECAKELLKSEGVTNPTKQQIADKTNELILLNADIKLPKVGNEIVATKTETELQQEKAKIQQKQQQAKRSKELVKEGMTIASKMYTIIDNESFSITGENFISELKKVRPDNAVEVIRGYDEVSPDESLMEAISDEMNGSDVKLKAINRIFNNLLKQAQNVGVNQQHIKNFAQEMIACDSDKERDRITYALVQAIENRQGVSSEEAVVIKAQNYEQNKNDAVVLMNKQISNSNKSLQRQLDHDGWAGKTVDWISGAWDSQNRADIVKSDIRVAQNQTNILASTKTEAEFKAKFKKIYGVEFDPVQLAAYKKKSEEYKRAAAAYSMETMFNSKLSNLMADSRLLEETKCTFADSSGLGTVTYVLATKDQVYSRELNNFAEFLGMGDKKAGYTQINEEFKKAGLENASQEKKYAFLSKKAKECRKLLKQQTKIACNGKTFNRVKKEYDSSYAATFGTTNDISRRVENYNQSQETGTFVLTSGVKIVGATVIGVATGGAGVVPLLTAAASTAAFSAAVDISDRVSSNDGLSMAELKTITKNSVIDGATMVVSGGASNIVKSLKLGTAASYAVRTGTDTLVDMGAEYLQTGRVTLESTLMSAVASAVGQGAERVLDARQIEKHVYSQVETPSAEQVASRNYDVNSNKKVVETTTAEVTNDWWKTEMNYDNPPYLPGTPVEIMELTETTTFVRVLDGKNSGVFGGWVMKLEDIQGLTPAQIKDKFALPTTPKYIVDVTLEKGTKIRKGTVNPLEGWGIGGGTQFDLMGQRVGKFDNPRKISGLVK